MDKGETVRSANMYPIGHTAVADIDDIEPLSERDEACLEEIRTVLAKHGALERFGVALLHGHFAVGVDEVLVEYPDPANRRLISRVQKRSTVDPAKVVETQWRFGSEPVTRVCVKTCVWNSDAGKHVKTGHLPMVNPDRC